MTAITRFSTLVVVIGLAIASAARADVPSPSELEEQVCSQNKAGDVCKWPDRGIWGITHVDAGPPRKCSNSTCERFVYVYDDAHQMVESDSGSPERRRETYDCLRCAGLLSPLDGGSSDASDSADCGCTIRQQSSTQGFGYWIFAAANLVFMVFVLRRYR
jgi:hypothetical protein